MDSDGDGDVDVVLSTNLSLESAFLRVNPRNFLDLGLLLLSPSTSLFTGVTLRVGPSFWRRISSWFPATDSQLVADSFKRHHVL